jgi:hypothetical protein
MQQGTIHRAGQAEAVGWWRADTQSLTIRTDDAELRRAADEILGRPQAIPVHGAENFQFAVEAVPTVERPSTIRHLALVALELEARGFTMEPDEESPGSDA